MTFKTRTIAACDELAARELAPWSAEAEDRAAKVWIAAQRITPEIYAQERRAIDEAIEHLQAVRGVL